MSIFKDSHSSIFGDNSSFSYNHTCSGTNLALVVDVSYIPNSNDDVVNSITCNGSGLSFIEMAQEETSMAQEVWMITNPDLGSNTIEVNFSGTTKALINSVSYTGIKQEDPVFKSRTGVGKMVSALPIKSFSKVSGISIGIGSTDDEDSYVTSLTPVQTEEYKTIASGLGICSQTISAQLPVTLDSISVDNVLTKSADWAIVIIGLEGA
jgi:hypothetical protein